MHEHVQTKRGKQQHVKGNLFFFTHPESTKVPKKVPKDGRLCADMKAGAISKIASFFPSEIQVFNRQAPIFISTNNIQNV